MFSQSYYSRVFGSLEHPHGGAEGRSLVSAVSGTGGSVAATPSWGSAAIPWPHVGQRTRPLGSRFMTRRTILVTRSLRISLILVSLGRGP